MEKVSSDKHEGDAVCVISYKDRVFSGGADGKIKVWDTELNLINTVNAHDGYIYAMAVNMDGKIYSSSCDGSVKFMVAPYNDDCVQELFRCPDAIQAMYCDGNILFTGDEKGVVTNWENDKMLFKYNLVEEVKSLAAEKNLVYTVRDLDVVVSDFMPGKSGKYCNKADIPGKSPLSLIGKIVEGKRSLLAFADRTGMGLLCVSNLPTEKFQCKWTLPNCHEMIINALSGNENYLYSGGYDNKVKGWADCDKSEPKCLGTVDVGACVNGICCGDDNAIFIASSDGAVRRVKFI